MGEAAVQDLNQSLFPHRGEFELNALKEGWAAGCFQTVGLDKFQVSGRSLGECGSGQ